MQESPTPSGGPWVTSSLVPSGTPAHLEVPGDQAHLCLSSSPLGRLKAELEKTGCQGEPWILIPSRVTEESSR